MFKKIMSMFMILLLMLVNAPQVKADEVERRNASDLVAQSFLDGLNTNLDIKYATPLYDGSDEINGYWYHLYHGNNTGYIIVYNRNSRLIVTEFSLEDDLDLNTNNKIYYNGLVAYYEKINSNQARSEVFGDICIDDITVQEDISIPQTLQRTKKQNMLVTSNYGNTRLPFTMTPIIQTNVTGTVYPGNTLCTQTSAAMIIQYYKEHRTGFGQIASHTGTQLVLDIIDKMTPQNIGGSTTTAELESGMREYVESRGYNIIIDQAISDEYGNRIPGYFPDDIYDDIKAGAPGIVIIGNNAKTANGGYQDPSQGENYDFANGTLHAMPYIGIYTHVNTGATYLHVIDPLDGKQKTLYYDVYWYPGEESAIYCISKMWIY